jgi:hypothetical protein
MITATWLVICLAIFWRFSIGVGLILALLGSCAIQQYVPDAKPPVVRVERGS